MPAPDCDTLTTAERARLAPYVTDPHGSVFALTELPEVVKGALFARYSRSSKGLRRLLLDEFLGDLPAAGAAGHDAAASGRAARLYERVLGEYGDDSVAQLGAAHVAVEQTSNLLTKTLEWGRLASYLEQSTRYVPYDDQPGGRYRYYRDPEILASPLGPAYVGTLDAVFETYARLRPRVAAWASDRYPRDATTSDAAYRATIRAKSCDVLRGLLPAATTSNVGIFASGQAYEQLLLRLRGHELTEARETGERMLSALRQVIPSFLTRLDRPERGGAWTRYLADTRSHSRAVTAELLKGFEPEPTADVTLTAWSPEAEVELLTGILYEHAQLGEEQLRRVVEAMGVDDRLRLVRAYVGDRRNRRHKPGRALERLWYRFDVCSDYGAFRDLQRHRLLTIVWQDLSPRHGYATPEEVDSAGIAAEWHRALESQAGLWARLHPELPAQSQYAVGFAYRLRYNLQLNARAALHLIELRSAPQGHPSYRHIAQRMHGLIADRAGHHAVAELMRFADHSPVGLERLVSEQAAEERRAHRAAGGLNA